jgi:hypothetical protein
MRDAAAAGSIACLRPRAVSWRSSRQRAASRWRAEAGGGRAGDRELAAALAPLSGERASTRNHFRRICRNADLGYTNELMELYDDVAEDGYVGSKLRIMKSAIACAPFEWSPATTRRSAPRSPTRPTRCCGA